MVCSDYDGITWCRRVLRRYKIVSTSALPRDTLYRGLDAPCNFLPSSRLGTRARLTRRIFALAYRLIHIPRLTWLPSSSSFGPHPAACDGARDATSARTLASQKFSVACPQLLRSACAMMAERYIAIVKRIRIIRLRYPSMFYWRPLLVAARMLAILLKRGERCP